jgi:cellulose synthase/poly-beta-1,6-N-acetylglucosamine synthase-like glycosyltransferase
VSSTLLVVIFWAGILSTVYAYVLFPALATLLAASHRSREGRRSSGSPLSTPVTIIIPAYNEESSLEAKIENVLATDYPRELLDVMVVSDGSTDRTNAIAMSYEPRGVRLLVQERRQGKTAGLNRALGVARGEIVVFTDANAAYQPTTIGTMVSYFQDDRVGMVSGYTAYTVTGTGEVSEATNAYTSLERVIKRAESAWGCCVGADGAIFAMRRSLFRPLREDDINDFVLPLSVISQGYRCLLAEDAQCSENPGKSLESEFRRQSRITNRSLRAIGRHGHLLNPFRFPLFSFFLFSHKVVRFLAPVLLLASAVALLALAALEGGAYLVMAALGGAVAVMLAHASRASSESWLHRNRLMRMLSVFAIMNLAMLHGWGKFVTGRTEVTWQHDRVLSR